MKVILLTASHLPDEKLHGGMTRVVPDQLPDTLVMKGVCAWEMPALAPIPINMRRRTSSDRERFIDKILQLFWV